mgnify:FL=1
MLDYFNGLIGCKREIDGRISDRFGLERNITRQLDRFMNVELIVDIHFREIQL